MAVSYTHLDVYKRQGFADPFLQVGSYGSHIGHEANRVLKNVLVDSLEHIFGSRVGFDPQGEIDMSVAKDLAFNRRCLLYTSRCV